MLRPYAHRGRIANPRMQPHPICAHDGTAVIIITIVIIVGAQG